MSLRAVHLLAWTALVVLALAPLVAILSQALTPQGGTLPLLTALGEPSLLRPALNTVLLGLLVALFSLLFGAALAGAEALARPRTMSVLYPLVLVPYLLPPYLMATAWNALLQPHGLVYLVFGAQPEWTTALLYSLPGIALVMASHLAPLAYLLFRGYQQGRSQRALWSARVHGASPLYAFRRVVLPDFLPVIAAVFLITFIAGIEEYGAPAVLGGYANLTVLTTEVQKATGVWPIDLGRAASLSVLLLVLASAAWLPFRRLSQQRTSTASLPPPVRATSLWSSAVFAAYGLVAAVLPVAAVVTLAFMRAQTNGLRAGNFTFAHFAALADPSGDARGALLTSLQLAVETTLLALTLAFVVAYALRRGGRGAAVLDLLAALPSAAPGLVVAVGIILLWNAPWNPLPVYNHLAILVVGYAVVVFPTALRYAQLGLAKIPRRWEWAAAVHGADPLRTLGRVVLPLARPALLAGAPIVFGLAMRELVMSIMLQPPGTFTISTYVLAQFEQGEIGNAMAMAVTGVLSSAAIIGVFEFFVTPAGGVADEGPAPAASKDTAAWKPQSAAT